MKKTMNITTTKGNEIKIEINTDIQGIITIEAISENLTGYVRTEIKQDADKFITADNKLVLHFSDGDACQPDAIICLTDDSVEGLKKALANIDKPKFTGKKAVTFEGYEFRFWKNGTARRIYINGTRCDGSYIDLNTMERKLSRKAWAEFPGIVESFMSTYDICC